MDLTYTGARQLLGEPGSFRRALRKLLGFPYAVVDDLLSAYARERLEHERTRQRLDEAYRRIAALQRGPAPAPEPVCTTQAEQVPYRLPSYTAIAALGGDQRVAVVIPNLAALRLAQQSAEKDLGELVKVRRHAYLRLHSGTQLYFLTYFALQDPDGVPEVDGFLCDGFGLPDPFWQSLRAKLPSRPG